MEQVYGVISFHANLTLAECIIRGTPIVAADTAEYSWDLYTCCPQSGFNVLNFNNI